MSFSIKLILPVFPSNAKEIYFMGYTSISEQNLATIYITNYRTSNNFVMEQNSMQNVIYGHRNGFKKKKKRSSRCFSNYLILDENFQIKTLLIHGKETSLIDNCIIILYDHDKIEKSETIFESADLHLKLQNLIHNECNVTHPKATYPILKIPFWLSSSMFGQHLSNYINLINWLITTIRRDKKVAIRQGNLILAIIVDILLGYFVLRLLTQDKTQFSSALMGVLEKLVNSLYSLLKWLMGAPAGLKLNNAFNKMLGKYFSYHIQLWWQFLDVSGEKLDIILHIYHYLGYLGYTFQAAIISDMVCVATFHTYCIYVYAARLFNIQICGLIALLRLFVGRKYNPLRGGIDSCEYTNQELFVGTVAFTILLLLLPTTAMYYIVFTLFRLLSMGVQYTLAKSIYFVQTLPLYVAVLWIVNSPKVAGHILIEVIDSKEASPLILRIKLCTKPVHDLLKNFKPAVDLPKRIEWTNLLSNIFVGKQII